ncbi:MAG: 4-(cytidine 5'-diphospho)-2-C-methyl-D-erythritol kinase [Candidatus Kapaibacterium sp.]
MYITMNLLNYYAYSKINLGLQVLNQREDGYHNINTVFCLINLYDEIDFFPSDKIEIITTPDLGIKQENNLIYKAGEIFFREFHVNGGFRAIIKKNIPTGSGLGGGSSDASTTVIALNRMYKTAGAFNSLKRIVNQVGSDCTFFLSGYRLAAATGRGEILRCMHTQLSFNIIIVNPGIPISTAQTYRLLNRGTEPIEEVDFTSIINDFANEPAKYNGKIFNDFEEHIFRQHPEIENIKNKLYQIGADFALMSGSGSTVFGLFKKDITLEELNEHFPNYFCHISY